MSTLFKFKQFEVDQTGSTMRINTDGVLLGAMGSHRHPRYILDIGTGTGVIALMLAQKYEQALIDAVEIDEQSHTLAYQNFGNSKFAARLQAYYGGFEHFNPQKRYHLIVSNPPFFLNALKNPDIRKSNARHASATFYEQLLDCSAKWLCEDGNLQLILPVELAAQVIQRAGEAFGLFLEATTYIRSFEESQPFRQIIVLGKQGVKNFETNYFTIYREKGVYTEAYRMLLKPYFLNF